MRIFRSIFKLTTLFILTSSGFTYALEFEFINEGAIPLSSVEMKALKRAGEMWSNRFSDPITLKVNVDWQKEEFFSSNNILASVQIGRTTAPMSMVRDSLLAEAEPGEESLIAALPSALSVSHNPLMMNNVSLTLANAKALGITPANDPHFGDVLQNNADAHISFNLNHFGRFFYDQNLVENDKYDFTGIAAHELGHALGFTSIVDVLSMNPGAPLNPMLLDVFRFSGEGPSPSLTFGTRQTTPGDAQFYDQVLTSAFGSGYALDDPAHCAMPDHRCSASHWDDTSKNLMTSASWGKRIIIKTDDIHAVDRMGVDSTWRNGIPILQAKAEFYALDKPLPSYDADKFSTKMEAPAFSDITPNFSASPTHAFHISIDGHAGTGYAVFVPKTKNTKIRAVKFYPENAEFDLTNQREVDTPVEDMPSFPAHFSHFYFQSKNRSYEFNFNRFNFISTFSNYGAIFDPTLGAYGGFRLSGFLDGNLDGDFDDSKKGNKEDDKPRDYDASITMLLLLQKPHNIEDGITGVPFSIVWQGKESVQDNMIHIIDNTAFGAPTAYNNSSSYQEAWQNRVQQLNGDPEPGRDIAL